MSRKSRYKEADKSAFDFSGQGPYYTYNHL